MASEIVSPQLAQMLQERMEQLDMNPHVLAARMATAYDHTRKIYNGNVFPGKEMLRRICDELKLNFDDALHRVTADRMVHKGYESTLLGKDKSFLSLEPLWSQLTEDDRNEVVQLIQLKIKMGRSRRRS